MATGRDVRVAVIDSGVQLDHPDLAGQVARARTSSAIRTTAPRTTAPRSPASSPRAPTTASASSASRRTPGCWRLRACWQARRPATVVHQPEPGDGAACGHRHGAQVINLSLGGPPDRLLERLDRRRAGARHQRRRRRRPRAARRRLPGLPCRRRGGRRRDRRAGAGGHGRAPGRDVPTTLPGSRWAMVSGSSYAAAHVSGLLALMLERAGERERERARRSTLALVSGRRPRRCLRQPAARRARRLRAPALPSSPPRFRGPDVTCGAAAVVRWGRGSPARRRLALAAPARAQLGATVSADSDYRFRGVSLSERSRACACARLRRGRALVRRRIGDARRADRRRQLHAAAGLWRLVDAGFAGTSVELGLDGSHFAGDSRYDFAEPTRA